MFTLRSLIDGGCGIVGGEGLKISKINSRLEKIENLIAEISFFVLSRQTSRPVVHINSPLEHFIYSKTKSFCPPWLEEENFVILKPLKQS